MAGDRTEIKLDPAGSRYGRLNVNAATHQRMHALINVIQTQQQHWHF